ncbi:MAG: hypothetical protein IH946_00105 [Bacteroidetes bacterium]|nr:hypothetical protein [Bacteroidota bacterium]
MTKALTYILIVVAILLISNPQAAAQCNDEAFLDKCATKLEDFSFVKAYKVSVDKAKKGKPGKVEYSYVLSKGSFYKLVVCSNEASDYKMIANIYNRDRKLVASSFDKVKKKHYPALGYQCSATGVYYFTFEFEGKDENCGVGILGFKR